MSVNFKRNWQKLKEENFFSLFSSPVKEWKYITSKVISLFEIFEDPSCLLSGLFHISGITLPLQLKNDPQNKTHAYWLQQLQQGDVIAAHCMSELGIGTDAFAMKTKAQKRGEFWLLNGIKTYICNAPIADVGLVYAAIDGLTEQVPYNLVCFIVDMKTKGISIEGLRKIGLNNIPMGTINFENVEISADHLVAKSESAYQMVHMAVTLERLIIPMAFIGIMKKLYSQAGGLVKAEMFRKIFVCESVLNTVLSEVDINHWHRKYIKLGCLLKWQLSESYIDVAKASGNEEAYRDALSSWIYSGTNDVLKETIGKLL
jgi:alkylation response protein AidB-like acyl-CoA dehydrogenase